MARANAFRTDSLDSFFKGSDSLQTDQVFFLRCILLSGQHLLIGKLLSEICFDRTEKRGMSTIV